MEISFYCERGQKPEIGTGHYWRSKAIVKELIKRGHKTSFIEDDVIMNGPDIMVIDHIHSKKDVISRAKASGMKVVLIDGHPDDVKLADTSISAVVNPAATHTGIDYMAFSNTTERYNPRKKGKTVFVSMGGFDANNLAELVLRALQDTGLYAVVTKSNNHPDFTKKFKHVVIFDEENYYNAMNECIIGIVNGGLTLFQTLHYGLPCIAIPQYEHQSKNIAAVPSGCLIKSEPVEHMIREKVRWLMRSEYRREVMSVFAQDKVDGLGVSRICDIIEEV